MRFRALSRLALASLALAFAARPGRPAPSLPGRAESAAAGTACRQRAEFRGGAEAHYVVLVSLDGFRWDYAKRDGATHLLALGKQGVWAPEGMLPSYPSLTFPNHFTIVTGLYPEHHGLVANSFYDETKQARYGISDREGCDRWTWYSGTPLVEPGGEPGNAHGVLLLAGVGGEDRRLPAHVLSASSTTRSTTRRAFKQVLRVAAIACGGSAAFHHALLLRAGPRGPRIRSRRAGDQGRGAEGGRADRQAQGRAGCDRTAHRPGGGERSRHGQSEGRLDHAGPVCGSDWL